MRTEILHIRSKLPLIQLACALFRSMSVRTYGEYETPYPDGRTAMGERSGVEFQVFRQEDEQFQEFPIWLVLRTRDPSRHGLEETIDEAVKHLLEIDCGVCLKRGSEKLFFYKDPFGNTRTGRQDCPSNDPISLALSSLAA